MFQLTYLFDPLCGWCYAAAPALKRLAETHGAQLTMMPTGLFVPPRPVSAIADHARDNDDRIGALTGQTFTEAYHQGVMRAPDGIFSSLALTRALVMLGQIDRALEPVYMHAAQEARYVDGLDTARAEVAAGIAQQVARRFGIERDAATLEAAIKDDPALEEATDRRIAEALALMQRLSIRGVPQLVVTDGHGTRIVHSQTLYAGGNAVLATLGEAA